MYFTDWNKSKSLYIGKKIFLRSWNGRSTRYCQTKEKKIFQHLQSPRSTRLICCQTTFAVLGILFKLVFSVLHTIPFKLPPSLPRCTALQQPLTLTACDFNILLETVLARTFLYDTGIWKRSKTIKNTLWLMVRMRCFENYLFHLKVLTHRASEEEKRKCRTIRIRKLKI